ncbi:hypothetical protein [Actinokineospora cianjurensis]|uniref:Uncharacterized protein n=1 Tax=Actinokineospora cianjurensis TaxID=585224 RepID=A0A421AYW7_9PSEU|nr:hypothetical protein [Actinokineospora cianjurensis]RLK54979.1 hypothetical protein CLV68_5371 [Actinokineospora cianjurensis]
MADPFPLLRDIARCGPARVLVDPAVAREPARLKAELPNLTFFYLEDRSASIAAECDAALDTAVSVQACTATLAVVEEFRVSLVQVR